MSPFLSTDRREFLAALFAGIGMATATGAVASESGKPVLGVCAAVPGSSDHAQALASALQGARDGTASEAVRQAVAANRCPFCGCSLLDPFTGKPLAKHAAS